MGGGAGRGAGAAHVVKGRGDITDEKNPREREEDMCSAVSLLDPAPDPGACPGQRGAAMFRPARVRVGSKKYREDLKRT